ncbi:hypothetical protein TNCV_3748671 [Trichonephila clavipes]|nr:hypothetical protein TNCV_3748671 [Trichonephila clavipes]
MVANDAKMVTKVAKLVANLVAKNDTNLALPPGFAKFSLNRHYNGCSSPVVKVSDHGRHIVSSSPVPPKIRRVGQRCMLNQSRAEASSRWCGVVVRRWGANSSVVHVT